MIRPRACAAIAAWLLVLAGCNAPVAPVEESPAPTPVPAPPAPEPLNEAGESSWQRLHEQRLNLPSAPDWPKIAERHPSNGAPWLRFRAWYVVDEDTGEVLTAKNAEAVYPIASISKLATAMLWADLEVPGETEATLTQADKEYRQITPSRLRVGGTYRLGDLFYAALLASDNRAALLLSNSTGLGPQSFGAAATLHAGAWGLDSLVMDDPTGLSPANVATARDAARLLHLAAKHPVVGPAMDVPEHAYRRVDRPVRILARSSNKLVHMDHWTIRGSKTGFTNLARYCLVFRTKVAGRNITAALLGARKPERRYEDAARLRSWIESLPLPETKTPQAPTAAREEQTH